MSGTLILLCLVVAAFGITIIAWIVDSVMVKIKLSMVSCGIFVLIFALWMIEEIVKNGVSIWTVLFAAIVILNLISGLHSYNAYKRLSVAKKAVASECCCEKDESDKCCK